MYDNLLAFILYMKKSLLSNLRHFFVFPRYFLGEIFSVTYLQVNKVDHVGGW